MGRKPKWTYELVKEYVESLGYELISDSYINMDKRLCFKDLEGYYYMMSFYNLYFQKNNPQKFQPSNPYTIQNINLFIKINKLDFKLLTTIYKNNSNKLVLQDNEGYLYNISLNNFLACKNSKKFHKGNCFTIQNIKLWCILNNEPFVLLSDSYEGSNKPLKWQCLKDGCEEIFESSWGYVISGSGCPYCAGQKVCLSNCLATKRPDLTLQWHTTKNGNLTPYDVTVNSGQYIWWQCLENPKHEWRCELKSRNSVNSGCPYCSGRYPSEDYNLLINNPKLCEEWDYNKNNRSPEDYTPGSGESVWWKCKECGHEWYAIIHSRNGRGTGCPECNKSKGEKRIKEILNNYNFIEIKKEEYDKLNDLDKEKKLYYIPQKDFNNLIGLGGGLLSYDFYLPNQRHNFLIEFQGEQHERYISGFHKSEGEFKKQVEHDKRKKEYAKKRNINLLEIWYWDFNNIEQILQRELNLNDIKLVI